MSARSSKKMREAEKLKDDSKVIDLKAIKDQEHKNSQVIP